MNKWGNRYPMHRRLEVPNTGKTIKEPTFTVHIVPGKATEYQKKLWRAFWTRLLASIREELE